MSNDTVGVDRTGERLKREANHAPSLGKFYKGNDPHKNMRLTDCCAATSTYMDDGNDDWVLCCKHCYKIVEVGEGDGSEYLTKYWEERALNV